MLDSDIMAAFEISSDSSVATMVPSAVSQLFSARPSVDDSFIADRSEIDQIMGSPSPSRTMQKNLTNKNLPLDNNANVFAVKEPQRAFVTVPDNADAMISSRICKEDAHLKSNGFSESLILKVDENQSPEALNPFQSPNSAKPAKRLISRHVLDGIFSSIPAENHKSPGSDHYYAQCKASPGSISPISNSGKFFQDLGGRLRKMSRRISHLQINSRSEIVSSDSGLWFKEERYLMLERELLRFQEGSDKEKVDVLQGFLIPLLKNASEYEQGRFKQARTETSSVYSATSKSSRLSYMSTTESIFSRVASSYEENGYQPKDNKLTWDISMELDEIVHQYLLKWWAAILSLTIVSNPSDSTIFNNVPFKPLSRNFRPNICNITVFYLALRMLSNLHIWSLENPVVKERHKSFLALTLHLVVRQVIPSMRGPKPVSPIVMHFVAEVIAVSSFYIPNALAAIISCIRNIRPNLCRLKRVLGNSKNYAVKKDLSLFELPSTFKDVPTKVQHTLMFTICLCQSMQIEVSPRDCPHFNPTHVNFNFEIVSTLFQNSNNDFYFLFLQSWHNHVLAFIKEGSDIDGLSDDDFLKIPGFLHIHLNFLHILDVLVHDRNYLIQISKTICDDYQISDHRCRQDSSYNRPAFISRALKWASRRFVENFDILLNNISPVQGVVVTKLIWHILQTVEKKVPVREIHSCFALADLRDDFYQFASCRRLTLDESAFMQPIHVMTSAHNDFLTIRALTSIYRIWNDISTSSKIYWIKYLGQERFQDLFLHCNPMVRTYYMRFICWRALGGLNENDDEVVAFASFLKQRLRIIYKNFCDSLHQPLHGNRDSVPILCYNFQANKHLIISPKFSSDKDIDDNCTSLSHVLSDTMGVDAREDMIIDSFQKLEGENMKKSNNSGDLFGSESMENPYYLRPINQLDRTENFTPISKMQFSKYDEFDKSRQCGWKFVFEKGTDMNSFQGAISTHDKFMRLIREAGKGLLPNKIEDVLKFRPGKKCQAKKLLETTHLGKKNFGQSLSEWTMTVIQFNRFDIEHEIEECNVPELTIGWPKVLSFSA